MIENPVEPAVPRSADDVLSRARERVTVGPAAEWIRQREVDFTFRHESHDASTWLLIDQQHHAEKKACFHRLVRRLETLYAVHEAAQWRLNFDPATQRVVLHSLTIRRGEEVIEQAQVSRIRFLQREEGLESLSLFGWVTIVVLLDDVRVGDILDICYTIETQQRLLPERYSFIAACPTEFPLREFHVSVRFAAGRPMRSKSNVETLTPKVHEEEGGTEWSWSLTVARASEPEANTPVWHSGGRWVQVSDCESWGEVAQAVVSAWPEELHSPELAKLVEEIAAGTATPAQRVERVLRLVQDEVRYLSVNPEMGGQIPCVPGLVLKQRFGDCKDKSLLTALLLRRLGISARPVLVHSQLRGKVDRFLPTAAAFDHAIVEYELEGQRRFVDPTLPMQGGGPLRRVCADYGLCLPVGPGVTGLEPLNVKGGSESHFQLKETLQLDTAGRTSILRVQVTAQGHDADSLRRSIAIDGAGSVAKRRENGYKQFFPDIHRVGNMEWRDDRDANEFILAELYEIKEVTRPGPERGVGVFQYRAHLIQSILAMPDIQNRRRPLAIPYPCTVEHIMELESPSLSAEATETVMKRDMAFRYSCESSHRQGRWTRRYRLQTFVDAVPLEKLKVHQQKVQELWESTQLDILIELGIAAIRRRMSGEPLLAPAGNSRSSRAEAVAEESEAPTAALPSEPAPPLLTRSAEPEPPKEAAVREPALKPAKPDVTRPPLDPTATSRSTRSRGGEGHSSSKKKKKSGPAQGNTGISWPLLWIGLAIILGLLSLTIILVSKLL